MYCLRAITLKENMTTHMTWASLLRKQKGLHSIKDRVVGMTYNTIIYRITQLHVLLRVESHLRNCITRVQVLRSGHSKIKAWKDCQMKKEMKSFTSEKRQVFEK